MNTGRHAITVCSVCLIASFTVSAATDNPYGKIVVRNLFGLKDPPPPPDPESTKPPPPGIYLQGLTTILGRNQVLFKVTLPARPPQPATEVSKIVAEGDREGEISVLEINMAERTVKFDNHGTIEVRNMKDHSAKPGGGQAVAGGVPQPGLMPQPVSAGLPAVPIPSATPPTALGMTGAGTSARATGLQSIPTRQPRTAYSEGSRSVPLPGTAPVAPGRILSPEEQIIMMEIERERTKGIGGPPLPATPITPNPTPADTNPE